MIVVEKRQDSDPPRHLTDRQVEWGLMLFLVLVLSLWVLFAS